MTSTNDIESRWNETKCKLKQKFYLLTNNDFLLFDGKQEEILVRLQCKLGKTKEEIQKIIAEI